MMTRRKFLIEVGVVLGATALGSRAWGSIPVPAPVTPLAPSALDEILGESPAIKALRDSARRILGGLAADRRPPPVVVVGETGSGKGLVASVLHRGGPRAAAPFVPICAAAIPEGVLESEMVGFECQAFRGATSGRAGLIQAAHHGVLYLDEMSLMAERLRVSVLAAIESGAVRRLNATRDEPADIWLIASGYARADVLCPSRAIVLTIPPLRECGDDVLLMADHYLHRYCREYQLPTKTLSRSARAALRSYCWPGNVRELMNVVERATILAGERIEPTDLGLTSASGWAARAALARE